MWPALQEPRSRTVSHSPAGWASLEAVLVVAGLTALRGDTREGLAVIGLARTRTARKLPGPLPRSRGPRGSPAQSPRLPLSPEGDPPTGEDPEQKLPWHVLQEGAGDGQVVAGAELTAQVHLPVVGMAHGASHGGRGQDPGQADPPLLHLQRGGLCAEVL